MTSLSTSAMIVAIGGAVLGACVGSYAATLVVRWCRDEPASRGRSRCDHCAAPIPAWRLVPVLSFLVARGRCAACRQRIDRVHPAMELAGAAIGGVPALLPFSTPAELIVTMALGWVLLTLAAFDLRAFWLPDRLTLPLAVAGMGYAAWMQGLPGALAATLGAAAGYAALWAVAWVYRAVRRRDGLGRGDVKLFAAIGAWVGLERLSLVLLVASLCGLGWVLIGVIPRRRAQATLQLPFGTMLALAAWLVWIGRSLA